MRTPAAASRNGRWTPGWLCFLSVILCAYCLLTSGRQNASSLHIETLHWGLEVQPGGNAPLVAFARYQKSRGFNVFINEKHWPDGVPLADWFVCTIVTERNSEGPIDTNTIYLPAALPTLLFGFLPFKWLRRRHQASITLWLKHVMREIRGLTFRELRQNVAFGSLLLITGLIAGRMLACESMGLGIYANGVPIVLRITDAEIVTWWSPRANPPRWGIESSQRALGRWWYTIYTETDHTVLGFGIVNRQEFRGPVGSVTGKATSLVVPRGTCPIVFCVLSLLMYRRLRKSRAARELRAQGHCACGYDLRATPRRCPECGKVPEVPIKLAA